MPPRRVFIPTTWESDLSLLPASCSRATPSTSDLDLVELNETFAAQVLACIGALGLDQER
jgi:acetyl-CoA acetyltransferase